ncbi:MAG: hypothetical protein K5787_02720 [Lentisphaeria bacterium]|nr:hypothetical protein [Lentisphaeria bacterium]
MASREGNDGVSAVAAVASASRRRGCGVGVSPSRMWRRRLAVDNTMTT